MHEPRLAHTVSCEHGWEMEAFALYRDLSCPTDMRTGCVKTTQVTSSLHGGVVRLPLRALRITTPPGRHTYGQARGGLTRTCTHSRTCWPAAGCQTRMQCPLEQGCKLRRCSDQRRAAAAHRADSSRCQPHPSRCLRHAPLMSACSSRACCWGPRGRFSACPPKTTMRNLPLTATVVTRWASAP